MNRNRKPNVNMMSKKIRSQSCFIYLFIKVVFVFIIMISPKPLLSQRGYIYSKEGRAILSKKQLERDCLLSLNKDRSDKTALTICQCQIEKIDGHFSNKQYNKYSHSGTIDLSGLISQDSV